LAEIDENRPDLSFAVREQVSISIKYEGYIKRQMQQVEQFKKLEERKLDKDINYDEIRGSDLRQGRSLTKSSPSQWDRHQEFRSVSRGYFGTACIFGTKEKAKIIKTGEFSAWMKRNLNCVSF